MCPSIATAIGEVAMMDQLPDADDQYRDCHTTVSAIASVPRPSGSRGWRAVLPLRH